VHAGGFVCLAGFDESHQLKFIHQVTQEAIGSLILICMGSTGFKALLNRLADSNQSC
jgi:hypothetical protein